MYSSPYSDEFSQENYNSDSEDDNAEDEVDYLGNDRFDFNARNLTDLHGCTLDEALEKVKQSIRDGTQRGLPEIGFIVGKGLHSRNKRPVIKPAVENWLRSKRYKFSYVPGNAGRVYVKLRRRRIRRHLKNAERPSARPATSILQVDTTRANRIESTPRYSSRNWDTERQDNFQNNHYQSSYVPSTPAWQNLPTRPSNRSSCSRKLWVILAMVLLFLLIGSGIILYFVLSNENSITVAGTQPTFRSAIDQQPSGIGGSDGMRAILPT